MACHMLWKRHPFQPLSVPYPVSWGELPNSSHLQTKVLVVLPAPNSSSFARGSLAATSQQTYSGQGLGILMALACPLSVESTAPFSFMVFLQGLLATIGPIITPFCWCPGGTFHPPASLYIRMAKVLLAPTLSVAFVVQKQP